MNEQLWAITETYLRDLIAMKNRDPEALNAWRVALEEGYTIRAEAAQAEANAVTEAAARGGGEPRAIGVVPIYGRMTHKASGDIMEMLFGGTSMERAAASIRQFAADPAVGSILLDVDSPGGTVAGTPEFADAIYQARGAKPIIAQANTLMASAAYWAASQADTIVVSPSTQIGSIGVIAVHEDITGMAEQMGIKLTVFSAGKYKATGSPFEELDEDGKALIQKEIDTAYGMFVDAVARGRGVKSAEVKSGFGQGYIVGAKEAVKLGMADRVGTLRDTLARMVGTTQGARAEHEELADDLGELEQRQRRARMAALR